jgi:hypothetical protein
MEPDLGFEGEVTCACGRVWLLVREKLNHRDSYSIECMCGKTLRKWNGAHFWMAELIRDVEFPK